ncbi:efflux RND transporter periplasmic adaptor subunit [Sphingomonas cannabina]|uniref:efflux RND transporter periplasmic adaptor subunit n=1 Tax=Sphingomonas cannabina TaxID=2899123 RepID=UPI001F2B41D3|nr:efflux RND transporter periplasmic adaptor subunit [Sphingomonas cannabina]UIJ46219.1 efflux RND transporter periplasmic adaptor subunit [Sphingomonas cannabina]
MARKLLTGPRMIGALIVLVLAAATFVATRTPSAEVEVGEVTRGPMATTVDDLAETRVRNLFMVSAPITGELVRVPLKPGARVVAGTTLLARIRPAEPGALDARTLAQATANVRALESQADAARAEVEAALAQLDLAERQRTRVSTLRGKGFVAQAALDEASMERDRARAAARAARDGERAARRSADAARAALIAPGAGMRGRGVVDVRAPISGYVLSVPQESTRVVAAGTPLVAIGDPDQLELVTDLLSADAVQVSPGAEVSIEDWGGDHPLKGRVRLIEPYGFLKVSALGVEEQRVNVVIDFTEPRRAWARLGHGFRATIRIRTWSVGETVRVPISALFRSGNAWQVFRVSTEGRAETVNVRIGRMSEDWGQVLAGLVPGDQIILHPGDKVESGTKVRTAQ